MNKRGQGAIEYLILIGAAIAIAIIVLSIIWSFGTSQKQAQAQSEFEVNFKQASSAFLTTCQNNRLDTKTFGGITFQEQCDTVDGVITKTTPLSCKSVGINKEGNLNQEDTDGDGQPDTTIGTCDVLTCTLTGYDDSTCQ